MLGAVGAMTRRGSTDEAEAMLAELIPLLRADDDAERLVLALRQRAELARATGDFLGAYSDLEEAINALDSLADERAVRER